MFDENIRKTVLSAQRNELTEHIIYSRLSDSIRDPHNKNVLKQISEDELDHYFFWKKYSKEDVKPDRLKVLKYLLIAKIFGFTFGIKLMERGEDQAQVTYYKISKYIPEAKDIVADEDMHEKQIINMIDEERLRYIGSTVRGLNDALVELTGAIAGFTFALQDPRLVAMVGSITGVAASLSMAASEYLATKSESSALDPVKASLYTCSAYILTVIFLIYPYLILSNIYLSLALTVLNALIVIFIFTFYISVAKDVPLKSRFVEMAFISLGIATLSFIIGLIMRTVLKLEI
ncbi:VIT1/CCC1 transporter family protein [Candidatus Bathyarchaeota archaeon]|nr:VIT1/CCC1 transporter family protein [Candidatus Bathyarchaeota archaeon]MBS7628400.1 VIT1/CCC1 transporter family protein [Candidatus Bathyarchaeota archaeon]